MLDACVPTKSPADLDLVCGSNKKRISGTIVDGVRFAERLRGSWIAGLVETVVQVASVSVRSSCQR